MYLPAESIGRIAKAFGTAVRKVFDLVIDSVNLTFKGIGLVRRAVSYLLFLLLVSTTVAGFVSLPYLLVFDPLGIELSVPAAWRSTLAYTRYALAGLFSLAILIWVADLYRFITEAISENLSSDQAAANVSEPVIAKLYRFIGDAMSWFLLFALTFYFFSWRIGVPIIITDFPNGVPSAGDYSTAVRRIFE